MEQKLPKEFKEKWLSALRSGEYTQAREALWVGNGYCCLGVACKVAKQIEDSYRESELNINTVEMEGYKRGLITILNKLKEYAKWTEEE